MSLNMGLHRLEATLSSTTLKALNLVQRKRLRLLVGLHWEVWCTELDKSQRIWWKALFQADSSIVPAWTAWIRLTRLDSAWFQPWQPSSSLVCMIHGDSKLLLTSMESMDQAGQPEAAPNHILSSTLVSLASGIVHGTSRLHPCCLHANNIIVFPLFILSSMLSSLSTLTSLTRH